jgi:hypothetical protein
VFTTCEDVRFSAVNFTNATIIDAVCDGIREVVVLDADIVARYQGEPVVFMLPRLAQVQTVQVWLCRVCRIFPRIRRSAKGVPLGSAAEWF